MIDFKKELNAEQLEVVTKGDGYCLVLAGAGSGKTRTITYRVAYLLEKGTKPENILLLTFTNKAAKEMLARVEKIIGQKPEKLWGGTFHAVANRLLRHYAKILGYEPNFTVLDDEDSSILFKSCLKILHLDGSRNFPSVSILKNLHSFGRNAELSLEEVVENKYDHFWPALESIREVINLYEKRKKETNAMDFDDLLLNWLKLLKGEDVTGHAELVSASPETLKQVQGDKQKTELKVSAKDFSTEFTPSGVEGVGMTKNNPILQKIALQFHYILIDEYQDTNKVQASIVKLLASAHQNLLVVGDDAQSIYSFRAADINNILDFPKFFPKTKIFHLQINYRSTPDILELANDVIAQNKNQFKKELKSLLPPKIKPQLFVINSTGREAEFITERVKELKEAGHKLRNLAILFRAAFHAQPLEMLLAQSGIPYEMRGGLKFFERAHIKDTLAFLRLLNNFKDELAWWRVLEIFEGIGPETAKVIIKESKKYDSLNIFLGQDLKVHLPSRAQIGWKDFVSIFNDLYKVIKPGELVEVLIGSVFGQYLKDRYDNAEDRSEDIKQLGYYARNQDNLNRFLADISLDENYQKPKANEQDKLILSTIHQAKGLEWDVVFLINLAEGCFPNERALNEEGGEEEERRLFYVGITRAKHKLYLTYPVVSSRFVVNKPSPFIQEIKEDLIERKILDEYGSSVSFDEDLPVIQLEPRIKDTNLTNKKEKGTKKREFLKSIDEL